MPKKLAPEAEKKTRIAAERKRLLTILGVPHLAVKATASNLDKVPPALQMKLGVVDNAASMRIELEDLREDIRLKGVTELFQQSEKVEPYNRERPEVAIFNKTFSNYMKAIDQLTALLSDEKAGGADAAGKALTAFITQVQNG